MKMHDDELHISEDVARQLIADQFPLWRGEQVRQLPKGGTVNAIFRIGSGLAARFLLRSGDPATIGAQLAREADAMRDLAAISPFPSPIPVAVGSPGRGYALPWSIQTWLPGSVATSNGSARSYRFADDLAMLIRSLRTADTQGRMFAGSGRGGNLKDSDEWMDVCFSKSAGILPVGSLRDLWVTFRALPAPDSTAMNHGDLIPGNLLVESDRLVGVLDGGGFAPGDPSLDLVAAWHMLDSTRRDYLRVGLACSDLEWARGAAWAFQQAMGLVWYYRETNFAMSTLGRTTLSRILDSRLQG